MIFVWSCWVCERATGKGKVRACGSGLRHGHLISMVRDFMENSEKIQISESGQLDGGISNLKCGNHLLYIVGGSRGLNLNHV